MILFQSSKGEKQLNRLDKKDGERDGVNYKSTENNVRKEKSRASRN